jgi:transglutaminase-like putative cysteine protease
LERRTLLKALPAASLLAAAPRAALSQGAAGSESWNTFEVITRLEVAPPTGQVTAWVPLPLTRTTTWFETLSNSTAGNAELVEVRGDPVYGAAMVCARFKAGETQPVLEVTSRFRTRDRFVAMTPGTGTAATAEEQARYLKATDLMPTDGIVRDTARGITKDARTDVDKARAIYAWVIENTERNPATRGCGAGDVRAMLETGTLNGKCADLNALFVALCRAVGVPARDVYGIRVGPSPRGYKSLGPRQADISKAQHCRAEFYAQDIGWVPVDPADVRKVILEEAPGLTLSDDRVKEARAMLWGGWEGNWLGYNYGHDIRLPGSSRAPVPFLMYPQAENAQGRLDSLDPDTFKYKITARPLAA